MIPFDPALPHLQDLLDPGLMSGILAERTGNRPLQVTGVTPDYLRYKPGTSCLIRYRITWRDDRGDARTGYASLLTDAAGKHATRFAKRRLANLPDDAALPPILHLPALDALWLTFPHDYDLPKLAAAMNPVCAAAALGWSELREPEILRYKPGRKAMLRYDDPEDDPALYLKLLADERGALLHTVTPLLRQQGVNTPDAFAWLRRWHAIAHRPHPGTSLRDLRPSPYLDAWMEPAAAQLEALHTAEVGPLPKRSLADEAATARAISQWLTHVLPDEADRMLAIGHRIAHGLTLREDRYRPVHGDFYDDQVLVGPEGPALLDLDELHAGHPLVDAGNMAAHLSSGGLHHAHDVFLAAMGVSTTESAIFEALGLLKLVPGPLRRLEPDWTETMHRLLGEIEGLLAPDPALPQLAAATSLPAMGDHPIFADRDLRAIHLVRHKPGRRAILRYSTNNGRIYGKTFASERGPKVHAILSHLCEARAFGPDVALPHPVAWLPAHKLLLQCEVRGEPVAGRLLAGDTALAARIAVAIATCHASGLDLGRSHDLARELAPLPGRIEDVAHYDPGLADRARQLFAHLRHVLENGVSWRSLPAHRDCYHEQFLVDGDRLAVLDLDDAAMSEPAVDIANGIAHLHLLGYQEEADTGAVIAAFRAEAFRRDPLLDARLVDTLTATTALRLAGIHIGRRHGLHLATRLITLAESLTATTFIHTFVGAD